MSTTSAHHAHHSGRPIGQADLVSQSGWPPPVHNRRVSDTPFGRFDPVSRPLQQIIDISTSLAARLPSFRDASWNATYEQLALVSQISGDSQTHDSVRLLFNLAVNDFRDLLHDLDSGSGRAAMRTARAVIEHAINLHTIAASLAEASRYVEHLDQGPAILRTLALGVTRLSGPTRRSYQRSLDSFAGAARRFDAAVEEHGSWFKRGWTQDTLKDRADRLGLTRLYEYYRLSSLVTHGSAGGSLGSLREHPGGFRTFRTGPALELAPVAMWAGIAGYREVLTALRTVRPDLDTAAYTRGLDALDAMWADYFFAIKDIDGELWPDERVRPPAAILAFTATRGRRWYLHLPMLACLVPAKDPNLPDWIEEQVAELIEMVVTEQSHMFRPDQRWVTAAMPHVTVAPVADARPIPDTALMEFPPAHWEPRRIGRLNQANDE